MSAGVSEENMSYAICKKTNIQMCESAGLKILACTQSQSYKQTGLRLAQSDGIKDKSSHGVHVAQVLH